MAKRTISNSDDIIDSRDVIERIGELEAERDALQEARDEAMRVSAGGPEHEEAATALSAWHEDNGTELKALKSLADDAEGYAADWKHGETLIRDSYFKDYAMELAEDIGAVKHDAGWPMHCIDWDQAARELQMDYTCVDFDGVCYWVR